VFALCTFAYGLILFADTRCMLLSSCDEHRGRVLLVVKGRHRVKCVVTFTFVVVSFTFVVVASCWSSSGDVELSMLLLPHVRTHLKHKKKKKLHLSLERLS
jgi:hypothetical protein